MNLKRLFATIGVLLGVSVVSASERPNFLFIIADDCTFRDIGCYGGQAYTPNIDHLATEGMKFNHCFQATAMCSPTRHNIYTGLYPVKSGAYPNHTFTHPDVKSIVHYLKPLGYRVALSGKTHINPPEVFPFEYSEVQKNDTKSVIDFSAVEKLMKESSESGNPFALFACSNEPHGPFTKGVEFRKKYDAEEISLRPYIVDTDETRESYVKYLAEISFFDQEVGRLLDLLEKYNLAKNTMVMVVSEQGNGYAFAKWSCYESGLGSAMVVRWPGKVKQGTETNALVEYVDVCPTFVDAAGGSLPDVLEGSSLVPLLTGKTDEHKKYVYGIQTTRGINGGAPYYPIRTIRDENYRLIMNLSPEAKFYNGIVNGDWFKSWERKAEGGDEHAAAMIDRYHNRPAIELYDVHADPYEMTNIAGRKAYEEVQQRLTKKLIEWMNAQGDKGLDTELSADDRMGYNKKKREGTL